MFLSLQDIIFIFSLKEHTKIVTGVNLPNSNWLQKCQRVNF